MKLILTILLFTSLCCYLPLTPSANELTFIYSGNLDGELEPCGCSESGDMGGLRRRATLLESLRQQNSQLVAVSSGGLLSAQMTSNAIKNRYILNAVSQLEYDAVGLQWTDLAHGMEALDTAALPWVASNWKDGTFARQQRIERDTINLTYTQWLDPASSPYRQMGSSQLRTLDDTSTLSNILSKARKRGDLTMLGTTLSLQQAQHNLPLELVDILIIEAAYEEPGEPIQTGDTLILQPGSRGMRLGKVNLTLNQNGRISQWQHEVLTMPPSVADAPSLQQWYDNYNEEIKQLYQQRVAQRQANQQGKSPFVGAQQCQACHATSYPVWQESEHAKAIADLQTVGKSYDPECLICHTVGLGTNGGYLDQFSTPNLANVQCENCHGAGREHAESAGQTPITTSLPEEAACQNCHNRSHSPEFNYTDYWPRIHHQKEQP